MSEPLSIDAGGEDRPVDLDWLADRFVLGELSAEEEQAIVSRLADDEALAAAVARSSRLIAALQATHAASVRPAAGGRSRLRLALVGIAIAAGVALVACWPALAPRSGPAVADGASQEVVRLWRQADETVWPEEEPVTEVEPMDGDSVPDWMLAAVGLDAPPSLEPQVQEN